MGLRRRGRAERSRASAHGVGFIALLGGGDGRGAPSRSHSAMKSRGPLGEMRAQRASRLTVCVSGVWAGEENVREQKKLEARKLLENGDESHTSTARFVRRTHGTQDTKLENQNRR